MGDQFLRACMVKAGSFEREYFAEIMTDIIIIIIIIKGAFDFAIFYSLT